jgi:hypothetical protein
MRARHQITIGRLMLWIAVLAIYFGSIVEAFRGRALIFALLSTAGFVWVTCRKHFRLLWEVPPAFHVEFEERHSADIVKGYWAWANGTWAEVQLLPLDRTHASRQGPSAPGREAVAKLVHGRRCLFRWQFGRMVPLDLQDPSFYLIRHRRHGLCLLCPAPRFGAGLQTTP